VNAAQRLASAREYLGYARGVKVADLPYPALTRLAAELRRQLGQVLDVIGDDAGAGRLAAIRAVLARFDWEHDDRQYALEEIDRIADGTSTATVVTSDQCGVLSQALGDAIAWHTDPEPCGSCEYVAPALCSEHAEAVQMRDAYIKLARELGVEVQS
jgi:hypothetical protein